MTHLKLTPPPHNGVGREEDRVDACVSQRWSFQGPTMGTPHDNTAGLLDQLQHDSAKASESGLGKADVVHRRSHEV